MLSKQFAASFFLPRHPGHKHLDKLKAARNLRKTVLQYEDEIAEKYRGGRNYKETIKAIHTEEVKRTLEKYPANRVLKTRPPEIDKSESELPRTLRTRLARLRSGFCRTLQSYMARIDINESEKCPLCDNIPHDVEHLFNCPKNPTQLTPIDLWKRPLEVANFLEPNLSET